MLALFKEGYTLRDLWRSYIESGELGIDRLLRLDRLLVVTMDIKRMVFIKTKLKLMRDQRIKLPLPSQVIFDGQM